MTYMPSIRDVLVRMSAPVAEQIDDPSPAYEDLRSGHPVAVPAEVLKHALEGRHPGIEPGAFDGAEWWMLTGPDSLEATEEPT